MANYTKLSELTTSYLANYLRITEISTADTSLLSDIIEASKNYILTYTGRDAEAADKFPEFTIAALVLCEDMFDKRTYSIESKEANRVIDNILGMHSVNLL
jgi:hypothetical protein